MKASDVNKYHGINVSSIIIGAMGFVVAMTWVTYLSKLGSSVYWGRDKDDMSINRFLWASVLVTAVIVILIVIAKSIDTRSRVLS